MSLVVWYIGGCYCKVVSLGRDVYSCVSGSLVGYGTHWTAHALNGVSVGIYIQCMLSVPAASKVC